ncbi:dihydrodipicolinate synthase family protein [Novipirellula rosea]|uniref:Dihydrodipicolinate synthase family protein n=1 Tax=Novipirellula rosea TaxID=1031540 RepID=A0ABP8M6V8_9BACT
MNTAPFSSAQLRESVIAVPPLARDASLKIDRAENAKLIKHLEAGGVRSLLYGGNAVFYHVRLAEYGSLLKMLADETADDTVVVPSIGPAYGFAMDQIEVLREFDFPTAMLLPARDIVDPDGIATATRRLAEYYGKPLVLYLKFDRWLDADLVRKLESDGAISWIKYAVVRDDPSQDDYLKEVMDVFPAERIVSGIGEQPAIVHLRDFGVTGFTSGCVCVAPAKSMEMMHAIHKGDFETAESIRKWFEPLEDLRNDINPIRVLHHAVAGAGICETGPLLPMLSDLSTEQITTITKVAKEMMAD